jgi:N-acetylglucosamine-6-phosphate deacetylase
VLTNVVHSAIDLLSCINNLIQWTGCSIAQAIHAVTEAPATMLGMQGVKGSLVPGADADLVILGNVLEQPELPKLEIREVWKFGRKVFQAEK